MSRKPILHFDLRAKNMLLERYFAVTRLHFDEGMGKRLKLARKRLNLSQRELADRLGLTQTDVARLESGKNIAAMPQTMLFKTVLDKYFEDVLFPEGVLKEEDVTIEYNEQIKKTFARGKR